MGRCCHCFEPEERELCQKCRTAPDFCFPRARLFEWSPPASILRSKIGEEEVDIATASMALIFWHRLGWDVPDLIVEVPHESGSKKCSCIIRAFASLLGCPFIPLLKRKYGAFLMSSIGLKEISIEPERSILLIDPGSRVEWLQQACTQIAEVFPKKGMILSLF